MTPADGGAAKHTNTNGGSKMTDIEWGAEIAVNGVRPEWLSSESELSVLTKWSQECGWLRAGPNPVQWDGITHIRLPATHDYYKATSRGFTYWPGGESAPADWDESITLFRDGNENLTGVYRWNHRGQDWSGDIIGYRKRTEQPEPAIAPELVERMVALVRRLATELMSHTNAIAEARAILAELEPDPDLTLAKSIVGDAGAIALAIKAARENGR